jgi:hypothetical protein
LGFLGPVSPYHEITVVFYQNSSIRKTQVYGCVILYRAYFYYFERIRRNDRIYYWPYIIALSVYIKNKGLFSYQDGQYEGKVLFA